MTCVLSSDHFAALFPTPPSVQVVNMISSQLCPWPPTTLAATGSIVAELELYGCIPQNIGKCRSNNSTLQTPAQQSCYPGSMMFHGVLWCPVAQMIGENVWRAEIAKRTG